MRLDIYALSEPNPRQDPRNPGGVPPDAGNPMATETELEHYCNQWILLKNQHDSFINIGHDLCKTVDKAIPDPFKPVQQNLKFCFWKHYSLWNCGWIISYTALCYPRLMTPSRPLGNPPKNGNIFQANQGSPILCLLHQFGYDLPRLIMYALNNITKTIIFWNEFYDFYRQHKTCKHWWAMGPHFKNFGPLLGQSKLPEFFGKRNICQLSHRWWLHFHLQHSCGQSCCIMCSWQCYREPTLRDWSNHPKQFECHHSETTINQTSNELQ